MTRKSQAGLSLIGTLLVGAMMAAALLLVFKLIPVATEYFGVKRAIAAVAGAADPQTATVSQLRMAFSKRAIVDEISSVTANDLDITKENGQIVISVDYTRKVPLFTNVSLVFDLSASTSPAAR